MIRFEERDNQLFELIEKPIPLTIDAEMPCLVQLTNDDSRLGMLNRMLHEDDCDKVYLCTSCNELVCHILVEGEEYDDFYPKYEIIGIPVPEGSAKWAWYQMQCGKKVYRPAETGVKNWYYSMDIPNIASLHGIPGSDYQCSYDKWISSVASTGWELYEPEPPKEPDYVICKRCAGSQSVPNPAVSNTAYTTCPKCGGTGYEIDEQEKEPTPQFKVGDWVECVAKQGHRKLVDYLGGMGCYKTNYGEVISPCEILRKLDPSEVKVTITLTGTVSQDSILNKAGCFTVKTTGDEYIVSLSAIDNQEQVETLLRAQEEKK